MKLLQVLCLLVVVAFSSALPKTRPGYFPRSYMLGGSFYANPRYAREDAGYEYLAPGQMTAMVVGDTVATNSFSGGPTAYGPPPAVVAIPISNAGRFEEEQLSEQVTEKQAPLLIVPEPDSINETEPEEVSEQPGDDQEVLFGLDEATTESVVLSTTRAPPTKVPARKVKVGKSKRPARPVAPQQPTATEEEEDDDDSGLPSSWPFAGAGRAGIPAYNAFFPIFIGGGSPSGRSRTRSTGAQEEAYPGSATAIANSFSTGKGGVATSHATSFGDPYAAAMLRNAGLFNFRTKSNRKHLVQQEDDE